MPHPEPRLIHLIKLVNENQRSIHSFRHHLHILSFFSAKSGLDPTRLDNPETQIKQGEKKVNMLIEESAFAAFEGNPQLALEKAKEAGKRGKQTTSMKLLLKQLLVV